MPDSSQQPITKSGRKKAGVPLGTAPWHALPSRLPEMDGRLFGRLKVVSGDIVRKREKGRAHLLVECTTCWQQSLKDFTSLKNGFAGCRRCGSPRSAPKWLVMRAISAKQRCTNPNDSAFERYGGRGIRFNFSSPTAMAVWIQENLGLHREMEIDRINNDGHYEAGNLRYASSKEQKQNMRRVGRKPRSTT